ncbi:hypothetical protein [Arthrobacter sp. STN4]|uniref:hypothetical protein n=1 Tax=Arthrobacter sp. STN4 TaxID=2923276 RepID=UPI00211A4025|nr:hypothetical protein [Arthrobacter sp. STN4]MCQ9162472.1 hypothetical protein [Arthrobacter sp. STN4]
MIGRFAGGLFGSRPAPAVPAAPQPDPVAAEIAQMGVSVDKLRTAVRRSGSRLPPLLSSQLRQLGDLLREAVADIGIRGCSTEQRVLLNAMICDYIPSPLQSYLSLPPAHQDEESKATFMFAEQLATLEETLADLLNQIRIGAVEELSTHGRFLADKFAGQDAALQLEHQPARHQPPPEPPAERDPLRLEGQPWHH